MIVDFLSYIAIRIATFPFAFLPIKMIHIIGNFLGTVIYHLSPKFRKRALSNLALASSLHLQEEDIKRIAKESLQNLCITCLEYAKLGREKHITDIATCTTPEEPLTILNQGKGIIFFCGHQSNWEILFLEGSSRMPGTAIARPIKNAFLYKWIVSIREKYSGKIITRKNAAKEGLRAIKQGRFLGVVGDQGMPDSPFSSLFFGRLAWTSPLPAILACKTGCPVFVAMTKRQNNKYITHYSHAIWPNKEEPVEKEIERIMKEVLSILEKSIEESPGEWLWSHNRWKQQTLEKVNRTFRQDCIAIVLPKEKKDFEMFYEALSTFEKIYPREFISVFIPKNFMNLEIPKNWEKIPYETEEDLFVRDFRFKLVFNFSGVRKLKSHFTSLSAFTVFSLRDIQKIAKVPDDTPIPQTLTKAMIKCQ